MSLDGKVAIVTGASSGIGWACAEALAAEGVKLVVSARRQDRLEELTRGRSNCVALPGDITDPGEPQRLVDAALERFGQLNIVLNNAGYMTSGPIDQIDIEKVCYMVRVNVEAAYRLAYTAVRHFVRVGAGHLVNTSSVLGHKVRPEAGAYAGTKHAIEALGEALRLELSGTDVQVSNVEPGLVMTELHREYEVHPAEAMNIKAPLTPEDIARAVVFILSQPGHVRIPRLLIVPGESML